MFYEYVPEYTPKMLRRRRVETSVLKEGPGRAGLDGRAEHREQAETGMQQGYADSGPWWDLWTSRARWAPSRAGPSGASAPGAPRGGRSEPPAGRGGDPGAALPALLRRIATITPPWLPRDGAGGPRAGPPGAGASSRPRAAPAPAEEAAMARRLGTGRPSVLVFHSSACQVCSSLRPDLDREAERGLDVLRLDTDCQGWAPEVLHYGVEKVPCLVLLDRRGRALARSEGPRTREAMVSCLGAMAETAREL